MPNAKAHAQIGALAGVATYSAMSAHYDRKREVGEAGLCALAAIAFAAVPDLLEPAVSPHHRGTAHSVVVLLFLLVFIVWFCRDESSKREQFLKILVASAGAGYLTHLIADGCTPKGLPLFG